MTTLESEVNSGDRLTFTLFLAAAIHALVILGITFTVNQGDKIAPTLNVTVATHKSATTPEKADFLAQANQEASGTEESAKELTTKNLAELDDIRIRETNAIAQQKAVQENINEQQVITSSGKTRRKAALKQTDDHELKQKQRDGEDADNPLNDPEFLSLKAKLEQQQQAFAKRPRIRRLTSVATKASADAAYLNGWAEKVELVGNTHFPKAALEQKIFGRLILTVLLKPNGTLDRVTISQSSGETVLDQAAVKIVHLASPFDPVPKEVLQGNNRLEIIRTWNFEITGLTTSQIER